jgi:tRNA-specific 2-thiouridylase
VIALDPARNAVILGDDADLLRCELECSLAWIDPDVLANPDSVSAQIRSRHPAEPIRDIAVQDGRARVTFATAQRAVAPGQTIAFFDRDVVVGSGVIEAAATG